MEVHLLALMGFMTAILLFAIFFVLPCLPSRRDGWLSEKPKILDRGEKKSARLGARPNLSERKEPDMLPEDGRESGGDVFGCGNLVPFDVVHLETRSGSRYSFEMRDPALGLYRLKGSSASHGKDFDMLVLVDRDFMPGRRVMFWSLDRSWHGTTTAVIRLLVDRAPLAAIP